MIDMKERKDINKILNKLSSIYKRNYQVYQENKEYVI